MNAVLSLMHLKFSATVTIMQFIMPLGDIYFVQRTLDTGTRLCVLEPKRTSLKLKEVGGRPLQREPPTSEALLLPPSSLWLVSTKCFDPFTVNRQSLK